jgi:RNA-binding protein
VKLSPSRRSELRAQAHALSVVVIIGDKGLTETVVTEIDRSLKAHELIKVRAYSDDRKARSEWMKTICERLGAEPVQEIGKVLVIYRENPEKKPEKKSAPRPPARKSAPEGRNVRSSRDEEKRPARGVKVPTRDYKPFVRGDKDARRIERPQSRTPSPRPESEPRRRRPRTSR